VQGQWLVRSFLEMYAAGVDRAMIFQFDDPNGSDWGKFSSCGLTTWKWDGYKPKISWYYVYTLKNVMKGMKFVKEQFIDKTNIYSFKNPAGNEGVFAVWNTTSNGTEYSNLPIPVGDATNATLIEMNEGSTEGVSTPLTISSDGRVNVHVTERPVFIKVNKIDQPTAAIKNLKSQIQVFPEITEAEVFVNISENMDATTFKVSVMDSKGVLKQKTSFSSDQKKISLSLENYPAGLYIINVESGNGIMSQKVVKH
jgi:hypothetical protein